MEAGNGERKTDRVLRVFISYRQADEVPARRLERACGVLDGVELCELPSDKKAARDDWQDAYRSLIDTADVVLCLAGPTTSNSTNIVWELEEATRRGVPVLVVGPTASALAHRLEGLKLEAVDDAPPEKILARLKELA